MEIVSGVKQNITEFLRDVFFTTELGMQRTFVTESRAIGRATTPTQHRQTLNLTIVYAQSLPMCQQSKLPSNFRGESHP